MNQYSLVIQWSDEDGAFLVYSPEWGDEPITHGETREAAIKSAETMLDLMVGTLQDAGEPLPEPRKHVA